MVIQARFSLKSHSGSNRVIAVLQNNRKIFRIGWKTFLVGQQFNLEHIEFYPKVRILNYKRSDHILKYEFKFSLTQFD